jgi:3',5'-cyclic AMP phosphodiesterase CpdA
VSTVTDIRPLRILHVSDTHLYGDDSKHYGVVDTLAALERVLDRAGESDHYDLVVASGDLSEDGTEESYRRLRTRVDAWAEARGAAVVYAMGNHDDRPNFETVLGERDGVTHVRGFRIVHLDSSVVGAGYGRLEAEQLTWLGEQLATPAEHGTVLVLHHPPIPATTILLKALELQEPDALVMALEGSDVRLVLSGHYHHPLVSTAGGIPVAIAPGITNTSDVLAPVGTERSTVGAGFAIVDVPAIGESRVTSVAAPGPEDGQEVFHLDAEGVRRVAEAAGPQSTGPGY